MEITGEYFLEGVREMASGFLLKPDNSFQFFFSYGALDRQATGRWKQDGERIIFNSDKWPGTDFTITRSEPGDEREGVLIRLEQANPMLAAYLYASLEKGKDDSWKNFDQRGYVQLPPQPFSDISLMFEFCPERFSVLPVTKGHTVFTIRPEQTLFQYYFDDFSLALTDKGLTGKHPLLREKEFLYGKGAN
ncbi:MAG: hypothetical protein U0U70_11985 [Chitinophagaceae bacterium]